MDTNQGLQALFEDARPENPDTSNLEGKTLDKYEIGPEIGSGGMGTIYLAKDTSLSRTVVIKVVKFQSKDPDYRQMMLKRFRREAQAACQVMHPNVAVTFAFDEIGGRLLLVMERIVGRTLREALQKQDGSVGAMAPKKAVQVAIEILKGLEAIHAAKIIHRDMKPGNVMLTHLGDQVKILDFGLGKASESFGEPALDMTITQHNIAVGSPTYMSPEQTLSLPVDARTDLYSLGVMLFLMLTGKPPFNGRDMVETYEMQRKAPVPPIATPSGASLPEALKAIVLKAMSKTPEARYASASEMRKALEAVSFDLRPKISAPPRKFRRWIAIPLAFCTAAALAVGLMLTLGKVSAPPRGPEAVIKTAKAVPPKSVEDGNASGGISIPPPPPVIATVAQGCELYTHGQTTDAIATLTRALEKSPGDPDGIFCLCGSYARQQETREDALKACKAYRAHPRRDPDKTKQVDLWLRRLR